MGRDTRKAEAFGQSKVHCPRSKVQGRTDPRGIVSATGRDTLFHRENAEEIGPHPTLSHPPKRTGEGERLDVDWGLGILGLAALRPRLEPSRPVGAGEERDGTRAAEAGPDTFCDRGGVPGMDLLRGRKKELCWWWGSFFTKGEKIPGSRRCAGCGRSESGPDTFANGTRGTGHECPPSPPTPLPQGARGEELDAGRDSLFHRESPKKLTLTPPEIPSCARPAISRIVRGAEG